MSAPTILLTGVTGNLGSRIAADIIRLDSSFRLVVIARDDATVGAAERVAASIRAWDPGLEERLASVEILRGDLRAPRLGLQRDVYLNLVDRVSHIIHCAAGTCFSQSAYAAWSINVKGTAGVMALAKRAHRRGVLEHMAHISTAYVCGDREGLIGEHQLECGQKFANNYEASKQAAERLLRRFASDLPLSVFRPSIVVGDSRTGRVVGFDVLYFPLRLICGGQAPALPADPDASLDVVPVDYVSRVVRHLTLYRESEMLQTFHVVSGAERCVSVKSVVDYTLKHLGLHPAGGRIDYVRASAWNTTAREAGIAPLVRRALELYVPYMGARRRFDDRAIRRALAPLFVRPPVFETYFGRTLDFCAATDWGRRARLAA